MRAGIDRAAGWLADAGYDVVEAEPPELAESFAVWLDMIGADFAGLWPLVQQVAAPGALGFIQRLLDRGMLKFCDQATQAAALIKRHRIGAAWARFSQTHPIVLSPVCCMRPWTVGDDIERIEEVAQAMRMVPPVNALGLPACAVPVGTDEGLPQGVQLIGARFREDLLLDAAQALENRAPRATPIDPRPRL